MIKPILFKNQESVIHDQPGKKVKVVSRAVGFSFGPPYSLVWNRPLAVKIQMEDGSEKNLPVLDVTRIVQMLIFMVTLVSLFIISNAKKR